VFAVSATRYGAGVRRCGTRRAARSPNRVPWGDCRSQASAGDRLGGSSSAVVSAVLETRSPARPAQAHHRTSRRGRGASVKACLSVSC